MNNQRVHRKSLVPTLLRAVTVLPRISKQAAIFAQPFLSDINVKTRNRIKSDEPELTELQVKGSKK